MLTNKKRAMILASGNYLTRNFPDNFDTWEEDELDQFMEENSWEPFENWDVDDVYVQIEQTANMMIKFAKDLP